MMVGGLNDPAFGPVVMAGSGGVLVELMADTAFAMCPLSDAGANALLRQVRGMARLRGFRGSPVLDEPAFRETGRARLATAGGVSGDSRDGCESRDGDGVRRRRARRADQARSGGARVGGPPHSLLRCCHDCAQEDSRADRFQRVFGGRPAVRFRARASFDATLHLLHVVERPHAAPWAAEGFPPLLTEDFERFQDESRRELLRSALIESFDCVVVSCPIASPVDEILRYAEHESIDLIVMGTHGRGLLAHALMGSVAERVVRRAPCPVLTVRQFQHAFLDAPIPLVGATAQT